MNANILLRRMLLVVLAASLLLFGACSGSAFDRTDKPDGDWSRGLLLGEGNTKQPVGLAVDASRQVHIAWVERLPDEGEGVHYTQLNQQGQVTVDTTLSIDLPRPRLPQLLVDQRDRLHLALLSRSGDTQALYDVLIDPDGRPGVPVRVSEEGEEVDQFQMFAYQSGEVTFAWEGRPRGGQPGIYRAVLNDGAVASRSLLVADGIDPFILVDADGTTHFMWLSETGYTTRPVYYASLDGAQLDPPGGQQLAILEYPESATYHGPVMGADSQYLYILWSVENLGGGLTPTAAFAYYMSFPKSHPKPKPSRTLLLPSDARPDYVAHDSPFGCTELAPLLPGVLGTDFVNAPGTVRRTEAELPVTVSLILETASKTFLQLAMVVFSDGEPVGYQLINNTSSASVLSNIVADADANLHVTWLDLAGFARYRVYYATTAPEAREWLDRTTATDVARTAADLAFGVLSGLGLALVGLTWNVLPLFAIILFYLIGRQERLDQLAPKIALGVAIVLYIASKVYFIPGLLSVGTPLIYSLPAALRPAYVLAVPVFILLLALASIYAYVRRNQEPTLFKAYLFFALTDGLLTAALYGPSFFSTR